MVSSSTRSLTLAALAAATLATAQSDVNTVANTIADTLAQFEAQGLIGQPINEQWLNLTSALTLSFGGTNATTGQYYNFPADTQALASTPSYQLTVPSEDAAYYASESFTAMFVDPGAAGYTQSGSNVTRHYLANDLKLTNGMLTNSTAAITSYNEPGPAAASGAHRYLALVFAQGANFKAPAGLDQPGTPLANMTLAQYFTRSNMASLVAINYILVENTSEGTKTFSSTAAPASSSVAALASSLASSISQGTATTAAATGTASAGTSSSGGSTSGAEALVASASKAVTAIVAVAAMAVGMVFA